MRAVLPARRFTRLMMKGAYCLSMVGLIATVLTERIPLGFWSPTDGGSTTCMGTYGNGAATGTVNTPQVRSSILVGQRKVGDA